MIAITWFQSYILEPIWLGCMTMRRNGEYHLAVRDGVLLLTLDHEKTEVVDITTASTLLVQHWLAFD